MKTKAPNTRFRVIEIKCRAVHDEELPALMEKAIHKSWLVISAEFLCSTSKHWYYRVVADTQPPRP